MPNPNPNPDPNPNPFAGTLGYASAEMNPRESIDAGVWSRSSHELSGGGAQEDDDGDHEVGTSLDEMTMPTNIDYELEDKLTKKVRLI